MYVCRNWACSPVYSVSPRYTIPNKYRCIHTFAIIHLCEWIGKRLDCTRYKDRYAAPLSLFHSIPSIFFSLSFKCLPFPYRPFFLFFILSIVSTYNFQVTFLVSFFSHSLSLSLYFCMYVFVWFWNAITLSFEARLWFSVVNRQWIFFTRPCCVSKSMFVFSFRGGI